MTKPIRDPAYLRFLRDCRCEFTGQPASEQESVVAMHLGGGMGAKRPDSWALPAVQSLHRIEHQIGTASFLRRYADDNLLLCMARAYAEKCYEQWRASHRGN